jgi:uncharacterized oligopeptide transporter (OPT) family protein
MTLEHGLLMGFIGCSVTFIGFFIAYLVASRHVMKKNKPKEKGPVADLMKNIYGEDCQ